MTGRIRLFIFLGVAGLGWGVAGRACGEPLAPELMFSLPRGVAGGTLTVWTPEEFFHRVLLTRPLFPGELRALEATWGAAGWTNATPEAPDAAGHFSEAVRLLRRHHFGEAADTILLLYAEGARTWVLDGVQLLYRPKPEPLLLLSFAFTEAFPCPAAGPGQFAGEVPLGLEGAVFLRRAIQALPGLTMATEQWESEMLAERFFDQAHARLLAGGYRREEMGMDAKASDPDYALCGVLRGFIRVYTRGNEQLTLLRIPGRVGGEGACYTFIARYFHPERVLSHFGEGGEKGSFPDGFAL